ncbi:MAG: hypothetical protein QM786_18525 [Breznakibacter sp.]
MRKGIFFTLAGILAIVTMFAADITLNIYKTDKKTERFVINHIDSVKIDNANKLMHVHKKDGTVSTIPVAEIDSMNYSSGEYSLPVVQTVSAQYNAALGKIVCTANIDSDGSCELAERGICWSKSTNPTIADNKSGSGTVAGKFYAVTDAVTLGDTYYVRAYATNCKGITYGQALQVKALMGNVTYTLGIDQGTYPQYYTLIKTAMDSACYYYNRYTSFKANIYVYYNDGIPTAQANYHGSMGFGPNTTYMWVGTAMHEMAHFFGSGTTTVWQNLVVGGVWQGPKGQALCQELTGQTLKGDSQHYWPTGINQRSEVSSVTDLVNHARVVQAMLVEDCGLPTSW